MQFVCQRDLENHLNRKIPCDNGKFQCTGCSLRFTTKRGLNAHIEDKRCKGKSAALRAHLLAIENARLENQLQQQEIASSSGQSEVASQADNDTVNAKTELELTNTDDDAASSSNEPPSQPPVDAPLAIIDQAGFFEFENKKIRKTSEAPQRVSVYDLIAAITEDKNPRTTFQRLQTDYSEVVALCYNFKFSGSGQRETPVTDAEGAVIIMNLLPGKKAAEFRKACADIIVRYLGGDETLIGEIKRNQVLQETAPETNPVRLFGEAVNAVNAGNAGKFHDTASLTIESATDVQEFRAPQFYFRQVLGKWSNLHPVGRPQDVMSAEEMSKVAVVKTGSMGVTERQITHNKQFDRSELLDSCLTSSFTHVETKAKDYWKDKGELYEGLHEGKTIRDTELLIVRNQEDYERYLTFVQQMCERFPYIPDKFQGDTTLELSLAQEKSKQVVAETDARKIEADASVKKAEANARVAEAEARKAEAEARKIELEILKFEKMQV